MKIPPARSLAVPRKEDVDARMMSARWGKRHANTVGLAHTILVRKVFASPAVIDVLVTVISMNTKTAAMPSRKTEGRVGKGSEAQRQIDSAAVPLNLYLIVNSLGLIRN